MTEGAVSTVPLYSRRRWQWLMLWPVAPMIVFLGIFFFYPVAQLLWLSVLDTSGNMSTQNFMRIVNAPVYLRVIFITFKISAWTMFFSVLAAYPVAYLLASIGQGIRNVLMILIVLPFWTSFLVRTFAWMILLGENGAVNNLLRSLGIIDEPLALIYNFTGVMISMVHALMPFAVLSIYSVMRNIDLNYVRAARTLGARGVQAFWRIYFPLSLPGVAAGALLVFVTALGYFIAPALLGGRREIMIAQVIITQLEETLNWRFASALSVVLLALSALIFFIYDRLVGMSTLSGVSSSSEKSAVQRGSLTRLISRAGSFVINLIGSLCDSIAAVRERIFPPRADRPARALGRPFLWIVFALVVGYLTLPVLFVVPVSFTGGNFVEFPPRGFSLRWYGTYFSSSTWIEGTLRSLIIALLVATISTVIGTAAAFVLARRAVFGKTAILTYALTPLIIPRLVLAVGLFYLYAQIGLVGTSTGLVLGHTVASIPYVLVTVIAVLKNYDMRFDHAAWSLGANKWRTFYYVTLPQIRDGLVAAFLFAFVHSFDELALALFITSSTTTTLPRLMWNALQLQVTPTLAAVSTITIVLMTILIVAAELLRLRSAKH